MKNYEIKYQEKKILLQRILCKMEEKRKNWENSS